MAQGIEIVDLPEIPVSSTTNVIVQNPEGVGKANLKNLRDTVGVSIDTVNASATTGLPGTEVIAKVKQTGTDQNKQFDFEFTIPKGDKGDKGGQFTEEEIKAIKVNNSVNSDQLGNVAAENYAKKSDIVNVYKYKGSVATKEDLPKENNITGDVYDVQDTGMNFAWDGTKWDALGNKFDLDSLTKTIILASHPEGTYYWTSDASFNPNDEWGGTWEKVEDKIIVAKGTKYKNNIDSTDLSGSGQIKLKRSQIPNHSHTMTHTHPFSGSESGTGHHHSLYSSTNQSGDCYGLARSTRQRTKIGGEGNDHNQDGLYVEKTRDKAFNYVSDTKVSISGTTGASSRETTELAGGDDPIYPLPPIEVAYCWKRTA